MEQSIGVEQERPRPTESWQLITVESALCVEPLIDRPEWFDEESPTTITEEMLRQEPGVTEKTILRFLETQTSYKGYKDVNVNERMNPFRANAMAAIITPAIAVFGDNSSASESEEIRKIVGDKYGDVIKAVTKLQEIVTYRKNLRLEKSQVRDIIQKEMTSPVRDSEKIATLEALLEEIKVTSKYLPEEVRHVYSLGRLTAAVLRESQGLPSDYGDIESLTRELLDGLPELPKIDYSEIIAPYLEKDTE